VDKNTNQRSCAGQTVGRRRSIASSAVGGTPCIINEEEIKDENRRDKKKKWNE